MECHGNVMEFYFSGKVREMSWNFTKMSWKKYVFTNSIIRKKYFVYSLNNYRGKNLCAFGAIVFSNVWILFNITVMFRYSLLYIYTSFRRFP